MTAGFTCPTETFFPNPKPEPFFHCSWMASSGKSSGCSKLSPTENNKDHCPLGNIQLISTCIFVVFPRSVQ